MTAQLGSNKTVPTPYLHSCSAYLVVHMHLHVSLVFPATNVFKIAEGMIELLPPITTHHEVLHYNEDKLALGRPD